VSHWRGFAAIFVAAILLLAAGCAGDDDEGPAVTVTRSAASPTAAAQISPNLPEPELEETVRRDLAAQLDIQPSDLTFVEHCFVTWPDASVGVAEPGRVYTQGLINGWFMLFEHGGVAYRVHGAEARYVIANFVPDAVVLDFRCP
jgi:hypothetical protein